MRHRRPGSTEPWWLTPARLGPVLVISTLIVTGGVAWHAIETYDTPAQWPKADAMADWLAASALADGIDPSTELFELAKIYEVEFWSSESGESRVFRNPRTPGSLLLLYPLSWVGADQALKMMVIVGFVSTAAGLLVICRLHIVSYLGLFVGLAYATVLGPARWSQIFGTHLPVILLCVAMALTLLWDRDSVGAGVWLAVAATLRLFPAILLIALLVRKKPKAAMALISTMIVLNTVPLMLGHVSIDSTLRALTSTIDRWLDIESNISLAGSLSSVTSVSTSMIVGLAVLLLALGWMILRRGYLPMSAEWALLLSLAVLALPLSWPQYLLGLVPPVLVAVEEVRFGRITASLMVVSIALTATLSRTNLYTIGLIILVALLSWIGFKDRSRSSEAVIAPISDSV